MTRKWSAYDKKMRGYVLDALIIGGLQHARFIGKQLRRHKAIR